MIDRIKASELREKGFTLQYIATLFGCSRQAVQQFLTYKPKPRIFKVHKPKVRVVRYCKICHGIAIRKFCIDCSIRLGSGRDRTRELVRIRDNNTCRVCGHIWKRTEKKRLDVHHLGGMCGKKTKKYDSEEDMPLLITLCHKCHFNHSEHSIHLKRLG